MKKLGTSEKDYDFQGACKIVKGPDKEGYVYKYFKDGFKLPSLEDQKKAIALKKKYFGKYIPETEFFEQEDGSYYIKQKYVEGKLIKDIAVGDLSSETLGSLLDLLHSYLLYSKKEKKKIDIIGYQEYPDEVGIWKKRFKNFLKIYKNFLISSNIMISQDGEVFMIDVCDVEEWGSPVLKTMRKFKDFCSVPFIHKTMIELKLIFSQKQKQGRENGQKKESDYT